MRILALYNDGTTRRRMTEALAPYTNTPDRPLDCSDHADHRLSERLVVRFHRLPALDRADRVDRDDELAFLDQLADEETLNGAWVETIWNPKPTKREREAGQHRHDNHKRDLRRALYEREIVSQFPACQSAPEPDDATSYKQRSGKALQNTQVGKGGARASGGDPQETVRVLTAVEWCPRERE